MPGKRRISSPWQQLDHLAKRVKLLERSYHPATVRGFKVCKNGADQSISNITTTAITFDFTFFNYEFMFDYPTARATIPEELRGIWWFGVGITFAGNATGTRRDVYLTQNGSTVARHRHTVSSTNQTYVSLATLMLTDDGDYFECSAFQDSGGGLNVVSGDQLVTWFAGYHVGL